MDLEIFRQHCLSKTGVNEGFPFGEDVLVFKVLDKIFATLRLDGEDPRANLKCDPERAQELRATYADIEPGYHMNKKHWNTIHLDAGIGDDLICSLVDHSYDLVVARLPRKKRNTLN